MQNSNRTDNIMLQIMRSLKSPSDLGSLSFEDADGYDVDGIQLVFIQRPTTHLRWVPLLHP